VIPIICQNNAAIVLNKIKEYLANDKLVQDICVLEENDEQIVFLLGEKEIKEKEAKIWWSGYSAGLKAVLS